MPQPITQRANSLLKIEAKAAAASQGKRAFNGLSQTVSGTGTRSILRQMAR